MEEKYWLWLTRIKKIGKQKIRRLLEIYQTPEKIWEAEEKELVAIPTIGKETIKEIMNPTYKLGLEKALEQMRKEEIKMITIEDEIYPEKLRNIYDPPFVLFVKGNSHLLQREAIAIIGCRQYSSYGKCVAQHFAQELGKKGIVTISGMAKGIDSFVHLRKYQSKCTNHCCIRFRSRCHLSKTK